MDLNKRSFILILILRILMILMVMIIGSLFQFFR